MNNRKNIVKRVLGKNELLKEFKEFELSGQDSFGICDPEVLIVIAMLYRDKFYRSKKIEDFCDWVAAISHISELDPEDELVRKEFIENLIRLNLIKQEMTQRRLSDLPNKFDLPNEQELISLFKKHDKELDEYSIDLGNEEAGNAIIREIFGAFSDPLNPY